MAVKKHCFLEEKRPCTLQCMSAYKSAGAVYCVILWTMRQLGYAFEKPVKAANKK